MKILLIAGRLPITPWSHAGTVRLVARGLVARGHEVSIACAGIDDESHFAPAVVIPRGPYEQNGSDWAPGFAAWSRRVVGQTQPDVTLSFSRVAWGEVWMPIEPTSGAWLSGVLGAQGPVGLGKALYKHTGVVGARLVERSTPWPRGNRGQRPIRIAVIGSEAAGAARGALAGHRLETRVVALPFIGVCRGIDQLPRERARATLRAAIRAEDDDVLALVSCMGHVGESLTPIFNALHRINSGTGRGGRVLAAVLARDLYHAHDQAVRAGAAEWVHVLGATARIEGPLAACDIACLPRQGNADAFARGATGRFAADALRMARPLLAAEGAPGAELVQALPGLGDPGLLVRDRRIDSAEAAWERALLKARDIEWRDQAVVAAAAAGAGGGERGQRLGELRFLDELVRILEEAVSERRRDERSRF